LDNHQEDCAYQFSDTPASRWFNAVGYGDRSDIALVGNTARDWMERDIPRVATWEMKVEKAV